MPIFREDDFPWSGIRHFEKEEFGDHWAKMNAHFLILLDTFRHEVGFPFHLTASFATSGHSENSWHYKGRAVDGFFARPDTHERLSMEHHLLYALRSPFTGIGLYLWSENGPFLHLDNRPLFSGEMRKIWVCRKKGVYENLKPEDLKDFR